MTDDRHDALPEPKAAHVGHGAQPFGPLAHVLVRHNGTMYGPFDSRHEATGARWTIANNKPEWFDYAAVPVGALPLEDIRPDPTRGEA